MKKILITGVNSYVGNSFTNYVDKYHIDEIEYVKISLKDDSWKYIDFSQFDSILHVAGIAHVSRNPKLEQLYRTVNTDLTYEVAQKAKEEGVKQFVFLSSIIVYGGVNNGFIEKNTEPNPADFYGESKLMAELKLNDISDNNFKIATVRCPMIYGNESKGNFQKLLKLSKIIPLLPYYINSRSMIHISNLSAFINYLIEYEKEGIFYPQNSEYVSTVDLIKTARGIMGKKTYSLPFSDGLIKILASKIPIFSKLFGDLCYSKDMSLLNEVDYQIMDFYRSLEDAIGVK